MSLYFFFQAEDGIRDLTVTGVQTCALPICSGFHPQAAWPGRKVHQCGCCGSDRVADRPDRKSTRLNSSHSQISYAVFCLKKKKDKPILRKSSVPVTQIDTVYYTIHYYTQRI